MPTSYKTTGARIYSRLMCVSPHRPTRIPAEQQSGPSITFTSRSARRVVSAIQLEGFPNRQELARIVRHYRLTNSGTRNALVSRLLYAVVRSVAKLKALWVVLPCSLGSVAAAQPGDYAEQWQADTDAIAYALILAAHEQAQTPTERIEWLTDVFVDEETPYLDGSLGEGLEGRYSQRPLYRFDGFNCTTFIETVLALALTEPSDFTTTIADFDAFMKAIRYEDGQVAFLTRNHFPSADWVPNNVATGLLSDVTDDTSLFGGGRTAVAWINKPGWYEHFDEESDAICLVDPAFPYPNCDASIEERIAGVESLKAEAADSVRGVVGTLQYLPLWQIFAFPSVTRSQLAAIPSGSIVQFVRPRYDLREQINTRMHVSHQGIVIQSAEHGTLLRHASSRSTVRRVVEESLEDYLREYWESLPINEGHCVGWGEEKNCLRDINILSVPEAQPEEN